MGAGPSATVPFPRAGQSRPACEAGIIEKISRRVDGELRYRPIRRWQVDPEGYRPGSPGPSFSLTRATTAPGSTHLAITARVRPLCISFTSVASLGASAHRFISKRDGTQGHPAKPRRSTNYPVGGKFTLRPDTSSGRSLISSPQVAGTWAAARPHFTAAMTRNLSPRSLFQPMPPLLEGEPGRAAPDSLHTDVDTIRSRRAQFIQWNRDFHVPFLFAACQPGTCRSPGRPPTAPIHPNRA